MFGGQNHQSVHFRHGWPTAQVVEVSYISTGTKVTRNAMPQASVQQGAEQPTSSSALSLLNGQAPGGTHRDVTHSLR
jgi:hypothetical protein